MTLSFSWSTLPAPIYGALIGGLVGSGLNAIFTQWREAQASSKKAKAVRTLIACEIDHNLSLLATFWERYALALQDDGLLMLPLPTWRQDALISQMSVLPQAFETEEIASTYSFYSQLDNIANLTVSRRRLVSELKESFSVGVYDGGKGWSIKHPFEGVYRPGLKELDAALEQCIQAVLHQGNAVRPPIRVDT